MLPTQGNSKSTFHPDRAWATIEAKDGGIFRSDDGGESWRRTNKERTYRLRPFYYSTIFADPVDENTLYICNVGFHKSIDGGKTFERIRTPHGDHHDHWINPDNPKNMILGNDGGACITFNGGKTWSSQRNQPTAQFYRIITDHGGVLELGNREPHGVRVRITFPGAVVPAAAGTPGQ